MSPTHDEETNTGSGGSSHPNGNATNDANGSQSLTGNNSFEKYSTSATSPTAAAASPLALASMVNGTNGNANIGNDLNGHNNGHAMNGHVDQSNDNDEPPPDATALKIAEYLDDIESANDNADTTSFQDIELPPPINNDDMESNAGASVSDPPESPRRAKKFYYCLPMLQMYKFHFLGCLVISFSLLLAIGLSARNLQRGEEALAAALGAEDGKSGSGSGGSDGGDRGPIIINDAPPPGGGQGGWNSDGSSGGIIDSSDTSYENVKDEDVAYLDVTTGEYGDEELGDELEAIVDEFVQPAREDDPPANPSGPSSHTSSLVDPVSSKPRWYQTTHADYQQFVTTQLVDLEGTMHPYHIAGNFCASLNLQMCSYADYCPFDKGNNPYTGGPPLPDKFSWNTLEETQWAPFYSDETNQVEDWVQVGRIPDSDGGGADDGYGRCYTYGIWSNGMAESTWDEEVTEDHRRWILCCPKEDDEEVMVDGMGEGKDEVGAP